MRVSARREDYSLNGKFVSHKKHKRSLAKFLVSFVPLCGNLLL